MTEAHIELLSGHPMMVPGIGSSLVVATAGAFLMAPTTAGEEAFPKSIATAQRALELDELQAEAHASLEHIYYHQKSWTTAEREFQRAIQLNPSYTTAHRWYSNLMVRRAVEEKSQFFTWIALARIQ